MVADTTRAAGPHARRGLPALPFLVLAALASLGAGPLAAQSYPARPVRAITVFPTGSGPDAVMRIVGEKLTRAWGQQVIVENRPGANGFIAINAARAATPDGYSLLQVSSSQLTTHPLVYRKLPYDPDRDIRPVSPLFRNHFFMVAATGSPWKGVGDLVAAAKARNGELGYGSEFVGSPGHLGAALFEAATGVRMTHVPFKETTQLFAAVGNNEVGWAFGSAATAGPAVRSGRVRFLAIAAPRRLEAFPDVPTVAESGGPAGFDVQAWTGVLVPAGTPAAVIDKVNRDIATVLGQPDVRERLTAFGYEPYPLSPAQMSQVVAAERARYVDIIRRLALQLD